MLRIFTILSYVRGILKKNRHRPEAAAQNIVLFGGTLPLSDFQPENLYDIITAKEKQASDEIG